MKLGFLAVILFTLSVSSALADGGPVPPNPHPLRLTVVTDDTYPPYTVLNAKGASEGYLVDLWALWEKKTGIPVNLVTMPWKEAQEKMLRGDYDVIDAIFKTPDRELHYSFSKPYVERPVNIYAHESIQGIHDLASLQGFRVGVQEGDACEEHLRLKGVDSVVRFKNFVALITAAQKGQVRLFCMDEGPANYYLYREKLETEYVPAFELYRGQFHRAVRKGDDTTLALVEKGMDAISPEEIAQLDNKWRKSATDWRTHAHYGGIALILLLTAGAGLIFWVRLLRALVTRKTRELEAQKAHLQESEEQFRRLFEDTRQAIALTEDGRFIAANRASLTLLAMDRLEDLLGLSVLDISPVTQPGGELSAEKAKRLIESVHKLGALSFEWTHLKATGEPFEVQVLLTLIYRQQKPLLHVVWNDITEKKRAEQKVLAYQNELEDRVAARTAELATAASSLRVANAEQAAIFDAANIGIVVLRDHHIIRCNQGMDDLMGYARGELEGKPTRLLYCNEADYQRVENDLPLQLATKGLYQVELEFHRKDTECFTARLTFKSFDPTTTSPGLVCVVENITKERETLKAFAQAKTLAEAAARLKADFVANMSHEIRTPMTAILGMTHLMLNTELNSRQRDYLRKMLVSGEHLLSIINDILDFSKIEAGKLHLEIIDFEIEEVLANVASFIQERCAEKGLELIFDIDAHVPSRLVGDPTRITQVMTNYAGNAIKFTHKGEITLKVELLREEPDHLELRFSVKDTGIGLSSDQKERIFQSFQQADSSVSRKYGGTGLGLAICKRIAEQFGGEVGVDSVLGEGATFWFSARLGKSQGAPVLLKSSTHLEGFRVLLVDDNTSARHVFTAMYERFGLKVTAVSDGVQALTALKTAESLGSPFNLVCIDWKMPGLDGIATAREISRMGLATPPTILMITAFDRDEVLPLALDAGIKEVLAKPISPSVLLRATKRVLEVSALSGSEAVTPQEAPPAELNTKARVLLVDDNEINLEVVEDFLRQFGLTATTALNGREAVDLAAKEMFDLILMDMQMPEMDGLMATQEIRKLPGREAVPIIALTANAMAEDRERCLAAGMTDHLGKPIQPDDLWAKLHQWLPKREALSPAATATTEAPASIPGLDVKQGLHLTGGRPKFYLKLLNAFSERYRDTASLLRAIFEEEDWVRLTNEVHALKGAAGQVGALSVSHAAGALEQALRDQQPLAILTPRLNSLTDAITQVTQAISPASLEQLEKALSQG